MGKLLCCCCSRSSTTQPRNEYHFQQRRSQRESRLTQSLSALSHNRTSQGYRRFERSQRSSQRDYDKYCVVNEETTCIPKLDCFVIPSFGKDPPANVAPKKASNSFLEGVADDLTIIQQLIRKDDQKELGNVELMCHFKQVKLANFTKIIEDRMTDLKLNSADNGQKGLLIWYTGHGEKDTGNWVFEDGCLKFKDIYNLYLGYFKGRYLYIVTDCCYSGAWVVECARLLDRDGIKCGHAARHQQIFIKVFAACLPNEGAWDKFYTECTGVRLHPTGDHTSIVFAEHRRLMYKSEECSQTTLGVDFTQTDECILDEHGTCIHHHTWKEVIQQLSEDKCSKHYLI